MTRRASLYLRFFVIRPRKRTDFRVVAFRRMRRYRFLRFPAAFCSGLLPDGKTDGFCRSGRPAAEEASANVILRTMTGCMHSCAFFGRDCAVCAMVRRRSDGAEAFLSIALSVEYLVYNINLFIFAEEKTKWVQDMTDGRVCSPAAEGCPFVRLGCRRRGESFFCFI